MFLCRSCSWNLNFLGVAAKSGSFPKAHKTTKTKIFSAYEVSNHQNRSNNKDFLLDKLSETNLRKSILTKKNWDVVVRNRVYPVQKETSWITIYKSREKSLPIENLWARKNAIFRLQRIFDLVEDPMRFCIFLRRMAEFHHNKSLEIMKLGGTLHNVANICLHFSTCAKFSTFSDGDKNLLWKLWEDLVGGPWKVLTRKTVINETQIHNSTHVWKSNVRVLAGQLYVYSMCRPLPAGINTRYWFDAQWQRYKRCRIKCWSFSVRVTSYFWWETLK